MWEGLTISRVEIRGIVIGCHAIGSSGYQCNIDDGTGRISVVVWTAEEDCKFPSIYELHNNFVSVKGHLTGFRTEIQIRVDEIGIIAHEEHPTEESLWWLEVKDEWESMAASMKNSSMPCPCLCHSGSNVPCRSLGRPPVWSAAFNRAVAVISSALRTIEPSQVTISDLVELVKSSIAFSASVKAVACFADCATVEAVRQLLQEGYAKRFEKSAGLIRIFSTKPTTRAVVEEDYPRYPSSQIVDSQDTID